MASEEAMDAEVSKAVEGVQGEPLTSNHKVAVKFLLSNAAAGIVIGRAGSNRTELQQISGTRIQLSKANQFYPGTTERVLLLSGTIKGVLTALYHILIKLTGADETDADTPKKVTTQIKIVMPAVVCGAIIGKGGATIKSFSVDSGTNISVSPQDKARGAEYDRIVTIAGGLDQLLRAVALVITKVSENPNYVNNTSLSVSYPAGGSGSGFGSQGMQNVASFFPGGVMPPLPMAGLSSQRVEVSMSVPDEKIGAIIGKGGEVIIGLKRLLNVKITISGRDEFEPGTQNRKVKIMGPGDAVHIAQMIVSSKIQQLDIAKQQYQQGQHMPHHSKPQQQRTSGSS